MKIALLIHVHSNPKQVERLVSTLRHPSVDIFINVDAKADICEFEGLLTDVHFIKNRVEVYWGRFSQVQQILNSFQEIIEVKQSYSHVLFISGSDYPIQPIDEISSFLAKNTNKNYIDYHKLGDDEWSRLMKRRYEYWFFLDSKDPRSKPLVKKILKKIGFKRKYPLPEVYYGSCWFCLTSNVIEYLLLYTKQNPKVVSFFEHSGCSDELYIQSVLFNSSLSESFVNEAYRYYDWTTKGKSPKILTKADFNQIKISNKWFARKLDLNQDIELFEMLDQCNQSKKGENE